MIPAHIERSHVREKILGDNIRGVAADLRLIDLPDLVTYLRTSQLGCIGALVQASIELSFKQDTLMFAYSGDVSLEWGQPPRLSFDMEFHHDQVHVYFRLMLEAHLAGVEITYISFDNPGAEPDHNTERLKRALESARLNQHVA